MNGADLVDTHLGVKIGLAVTPEIETGASRYLKRWSAEDQHRF
jgi:hypothetical protein